MSSRRDSHGGSNRSESPRQHHRSHHRRESREESDDHDRSFDRNDRSERYRSSRQYESEERHTRRRRDSRGGRERDYHELRPSKRRARKEETPLSDSDLLNLAELGVQPITDEDYFIKSSEFKAWLKDSRDKYLDEISSEAAHKYFHKFVRRWNDGALKERYYRVSANTGPAAQNTAYKWDFASTSSRAEQDARRLARSDVSSLSHPAIKETVARGSTSPTLAIAAPPAREKTSTIGPLPPSAMSAADRQLAAEDADEARERERKAGRQKAYERADELVPRSGGKEGKMDDKRAANRDNKEMRERGADMSAGLEVGEDTLMGEKGSFAEMVRKREESTRRWEDKREQERLEKRKADEERLAERKKKDSATMDMFKALAKERFG